MLIFREKIFGSNYSIPCEVNHVNKLLENLPHTTTLIPNKNKFDQNFSFADQIINYVCERSKFEITRVFLGGSIAKETNIPDSDIDYYLFIDDEEPPFKNVLDHFLKLLRRKFAGHKIKIFCSNIAIHLKSEHFNLDVIPVANYSQRIILHKIMKTPIKDHRIYSTALAEPSVRYTKNRSDLAKNMVRITKYWFKCLPFKKNIYGARTLIELVAIYSAKHGHRGNRKYNTYLKCFIRFLKLLIKFDELNIVFGMGSPVYWKHLQYMDDELPRVIDPVNPYNNLASSLDFDQQEQLIYHAQVTYDRLIDFIERPGYQYNDEYFKNLLFANHEYN